MSIDSSPPDGINALGPNYVDCNYPGPITVGNGWDFVGAFVDINFNSGLTCPDSSGTVS